MISRLKASKAGSHRRPTLARSAMAMALAIGITVPLAACASGDTGGGDGAESVKFIYSTAQNPAAGNNLQPEWFMDKVEELTDGEVTFERFHSAALLSSADSLEGALDGRADLVFLASPYEPAAFPLWDAGYVPLPGANAIGSMNAWRELYQNNEALQQEFENAGVIPLTFNGVSNASNIGSKQPIPNLADMQGKNYRFIGSVTLAMTQVGANPVSLAAEEVYESLERGVIAGVGGYSMDSYVASKFQEIAPHLNYLAPGYFASSLALLMNKSKFDGLSDKHKAAFEEAQEAYYEALPGILEGFETAACDAIIEAGGAVHQFPADEDEAEEWIDATGDSLFDYWHDNAVATGLDSDVVNDYKSDFIDSVLKHSEETDYVPGEEVCAERSK